ncbi:rod-binding protein [Hydrogenimonas sp.]
MNVVEMNIGKYRSEIPSLSAKEKTALKEETDAFEAIILKSVLDESLKSENSLFPKDPGRDIYRSMMNEERSRQLAGAFGYSELLFEYLVEKNS